MRKSIVDRAREGVLPVHEGIIDTHTHFERAFRYYHIPYIAEENFTREMDRFGVEYAFVFSFTGVVSDFRIGNDAIIELVRKYPHRLAGFTTLNINYPDLWLKELDRCWEAGLRGIKLIPHYQGRRTIDVDISPILRWANYHSCPILNHSWDSPEHLRLWAGEYLNVCFIVGHATLDYADIVNQFHNVYQCTCAVLHKNQFERMCARLDSNKIIYGSDFVDLDLAFGLGPILWARVSDETKRKVLSENAQSIINRYIAH